MSFWPMWLPRFAAVMPVRSRRPPIFTFSAIKDCEVPS